MTTDTLDKKTALISVYNKDGIDVFAKELVALGWNILSTGGTAKKLKEAGVPVLDIGELSEVGGSILGGRVKTLIPQVHGGLLAREEDREELKKHGLPWIDLACVDFYPLEQAVSKATVNREYYITARDSVINNTDIGGPTMVRSAAKGRRIVIADPADRMRVIGWLKEGKPNEDQFITRLAAKAEGIVAEYCLWSARFHSDGQIDGEVEFGY